MKRIIYVAALTLLPAMAVAQHHHPHAKGESCDSTQTILPDQHMSEVTITHRQTVRSMGGAVNGQNMLKGELFKAACCNLGESFVNNPSVDVNYSDATTGAKQIKLLGLSGTYVQMLTEGLPNFRGAALPYGMGYVPGSWMNGIQVSKGNASVKNGYEAMTGQINVEYLKPEDKEQVQFNLYGSTMGKFEANAMTNVHIGGNENLSTELLAHFENSWSHHDGNGDGFQDDPQVRQYNLQNRWFWRQGNYIFHGGIGAMKEDRFSGQTRHALSGMGTDQPLYKIGIATNRYEANMKHAYVFDPEHGGNIALLGNVSMHEQEADYGQKRYAVNEKNAYASLIYETNLGHDHNLSAGLSLNHDYLRQDVRLVHDIAAPMQRLVESETVPGAYAQYTFNMHQRFIAMAGLRVDHSNVYGTFLTPRAHLKWMMNDIVTLRLSAGKGYRSPHALAENNYVMASGRQLVIGNLSQEEAWNYGVSTSFLIPIAKKTLKVNAEYYYTHFINQTIIDYDSDPGKITIADLDGRSYSHTFQVDASFTPVRGLDLTAAYRYNLVRATYGGVRKDKPLQSRYKGLFTVSYKPGMALWQFDATLALNGGGRLPEPYTLPDGSPSWQRTYSAYPTLNAQVTREFRHFSVYVGGENLTGYKQKHPILGGDNPWSEGFEPTMVYGPVSGAMAYVGIRAHF